MINYIKAVLAALGFIVNGMNRAWMLAYVPQLTKGIPFKITDIERDWIMISQSFGGLFGSILALFANNIGRRFIFLGSSCLFLISSVQLVFAISALDLCIARFTFGLASAVAFVFTAIYTAEVVHHEIRGATITIGYLLWCISYLVSYDIGQNLTIEICGYASIGCIIVFMLTFLWLPESPYFLIMTDQIELAEKSLKKLRKTDNVVHELAGIKRGIDREKLKYQTTEDGKFKLNCKSFKILLTVLNAQFLSGSAALDTNAESIYAVFFDVVSPVTLTKICYGCKVIGVFMNVFLIEILGRKLGMTFSLIIFGVTMIILGFYVFIRVNCIFHLTDSHQYVVLVFVVLNGLSIGIITSIPLVTLSEILSPQCKPIGCAIYGFITCAYIIATYVILVFGRKYFIIPGFFFNSALCFMFSILNQSVVFETKGKTLEQIQERLETYVD